MLEIRITEEMSRLRAARARHDRCPSTENLLLVEGHESELGKLLDRLPRASISEEAPVAVS
jgi:hypothetical protein